MHVGRRYGEPNSVIDGSVQYETFWHKVTHRIGDNSAHSRNMAGTINGDGGGGARVGYYTQPQSIINKGSYRGQDISPTKHRRRIDGLREGSFPPASMPRSLQAKPDAMPAGTSPSRIERFGKQIQRGSVGFRRTRQPLAVGRGGKGDRRSCHS